MKDKSVLIANERATLETLVTQCKVFQEHRTRTRNSAFSDRVRSARDAYVSSPSDSNLEKCSEALRAEAHAILLPHTNIGQLMTAIELAEKEFVDKKVRPFVEPIIERELKAARKNLEAVKKAESKKIEEVTGHPYHPGVKSKLIDEAAEPVAELEQLRAMIASSNHSVRVRDFLTKFHEVFGLPYYYYDNDGAVHRVG